MAGSCGGASAPFASVARDVGPAMARHSGAISADLAKFGPHSLRPVMGIRGHRGDHPPPCKLVLLNLQRLVYGVNVMAHPSPPWGGDLRAGTRVPISSSGCGHSATKSMLENFASAQR